MDHFDRNPLFQQYVRDCLISLEAANNFSEFRDVRNNGRRPVLRPCLHLSVSVHWPYLQVDGRCKQHNKQTCRQQEFMPVPIQGVSDDAPHPGALPAFLWRKRKWTIRQSVHLDADKTGEMRASVRTLFYLKFPAEPAFDIRRNKSVDCPP